MGQGGMGQGAMGQGSMGQGSMGQGTMGQGGIRWAPLAQVPAPAPQAEYPLCTRDVQDQCRNTREGTDRPRARRAPRPR